MMHSIPAKDNQTIFTGREILQLNSENKLTTVMNSSEVNERSLHLHEHDISKPDGLSRRRAGLARAPGWRRVVRGSLWKAHPHFCTIFFTNL